MVKTLFSHIAEYKKSTLIAPIFIALEAILESLYRHLWLQSLIWD